MAAGFRQLRISPAREVQAAAGNYFQMQDQEVECLLLLSTMIHHDRCSSVREGFFYVS